LPFRVVSKYPQCIVWFCHKVMRVCYTDGQTDGQNYDSQDRASIAALRGKNGGNAVSGMELAGGGPIF